MSVQPDLIRLSVSEFRDRIRNDMVPLNSQFSYFVAGVPLSDDDLRDYLGDPVAAIPPSVVKMMPHVSILLVPFLEKTNGKEKKNSGTELVCFERPSNGKLTRSALWLDERAVVVAFGVQEMEVAEYHYELYHQMAWLAAEMHSLEEMADFDGLLREELNLHVNGEVDERSWQKKQALTRRSGGVKRDSKSFREYAKQSFVDTMTLYLHGICCDIDVETGPRQLPSRYLRKRLNVLKRMFAPPEGYAVFPEDQAAAEEA
ncbi:MAG: hypothetical protein FJW20_25810 [Acidimicrobiia bacterium]|nr:hypothetical protein [Acidimicrobiia bacterium]